VSRLLGETTRAPGPSSRPSFFTQFELQPQRVQGLSEGSQHLLDLHYRAQEDTIIQVQSVQGPPLKQGVQGCLDARRIERGPRVAPLHPPSRPDDLPANQKGGGLEGWPQSWHHGGTETFERSQDGRPSD